MLMMVRGTNLLQKLPCNLWSYIASGQGTPESSAFPMPVKETALRFDSMHRCRCTVPTPYKLVLCQLYRTFEFVQSYVYTSSTAGKRACSCGVNRALKTRMRCGNTRCISFLAP